MEISTKRNKARIATLILLAIAIYLATLLIYAVAIGIGGVFYYLFSGIVISSLLAAYKFNKEMRVNFALMVFTVFIVLYAIEGVLALRGKDYSLSYSHQKFLENARMAEKMSIDFDSRTRLEVILQERNNGMKAFPLVKPKMFWNFTEQPIDVDGKGVLPLSSISNTRTVYCNEGGDYLIYESDEYGFHNPKGLYDRDEHDIVAVGDSFTHGACVKSERNAVALIRNTYPNAVNLGLAGNGPLTMLATIKEFAKPMKPDIVLWFYYEGNDLADLSQERKSELVKYLESTHMQDLFSKQSDIDFRLVGLIEKKIELAVNVNSLVSGRVSNIYQSEKIRKKLLAEVVVRMQKFFYLHSLKSRVLSLFQRHSEPAQKARDAELLLFRRIMVAAKESIEEWGGKLYVVYLPEWERFTGKKMSINVSGVPFEYRDRVMSILKGLDILIIDMFKPFSKHSDPLSLFTFRLQNHYNEEGYRLVADTVTKSIKAGVWKNNRRSK